MAGPDGEPAIATSRQWRRRFQRIALRFVLAASWISLLGSQVWWAREEYRNTLREAQNRALSLANALAQHTGDTLTIADAVLSGLVARVEQDQSTASATAMHNFLVAEAQRSDRLHGIFIYAADGRWLSSSLDGTPRYYNNADRAYFRYHREHRDALSFIGPPVRSRSDGSWVMTVSRRLNAANGEFAGVVLVAIQLRYFQDDFARFRIGHQGTIILVNDDGTLLVRVPDRPGVIGSSLSGSPLYAAMRTQQQGTTRYRSPFDDVERISGFVPARPFPLTVLTGIALDDALANWRQSTRHRIEIAALGCVLLLAVGLWLDLQLRRMHREEVRLTDEANRDALTGVGNRRALDIGLAQALADAAANQRPLSLLLIDVDHFKRYNDTYGHPAGDHCLRLVAGAIVGSGRREDLVARYGGEEFGVVLPQADRAAAAARALAIRDAVAQLAVPHQSSPTRDRVTVSVGHATWLPDQNAMNGEGLICAADAALYRAKQQGRDRIEG
ncbi:diguanylate cyclase [Xanthomonas maliensis]|nr:diguanylate cyclase [Xanthomonas maliensis]